MLELFLSKLGERVQQGNYFSAHGCIMEERMITVVIPTYNRFDCMKYFFENSFLKYTGKLFTFEIHDSSEDDRVKEYIDANIGDSPILKYFKYDPSINANVKAERAVLNVQTEYVYLYGDRMLVDFNKWEQWLHENKFDKYLLIGLDAQSGKAIGETTICKDATEIFRNFWASLTLWGGSIVRHSILVSVKEEIEKYIAIESPFTYVCSVFEALAMVQGASIFLSVKGVGIPKSPCESKAGWYLHGDTLRIWFYELYNSVSLLPSIFPREAVFGADKGGYRNFRRLLGWRRTKNLTFKKIIRYKKYISLVAGRSVLIMMYLTFFFPVWFLNLAYKMRHRKKAQK